MCGLVGVINPAMVFHGERFFKNALVADTVRGPHSTGIFAVNNNGGCTYAKRAVNGAAFVYDNDDVIKKVIGDPYKDNVRAMIGHNRHATLGSVNTSNAHPFAHGAITLVHNGTLRGDFKKFAPGKNFGTDSEHIAYALSKSEDPFGIDVLQEIQGAYALIWHDADLNTLHIARNGERKLYLARTSAKNGILIASEENMLTWLAKRDRGVIAIEEPTLVPQHTVLRFDLSEKSAAKLIRPTLKEYTPKKQYFPPVNQNTGGKGGKSTNNTHKTYNGGTPNKGGVLQQAFVQRWCSEWLGNKQGDVSVFFAATLEPVAAGRPTELHVLGDLLEWDTGKLAQLHKRYKDANPETFEVYAKAHYYDFSKYTARQLESIVYAEADIHNVIVNWSAGDSAKGELPAAAGVAVMLDRPTLRFYDADFNEVLPEGNKQKKPRGGGSKEGAAAQEPLPVPKALPAPTATEGSDGEEESPEVLRGPGNVYVPVATWSSMTSAGCCHCGGTIARMDHELIEWTRDSSGKQVPICHHCIDDVREFAPQLLH